MKTTSVLLQSLCAPCCNRCRYCLLSWNGEIEGVDWDRSVRFAERFLREIKEQRPDVRASFAYGYAMEHPDLAAAIRILRRLGSPMADFLQCDGMKMRDESACIALMETLRKEGVKQLNFTVYGPRKYHDRFAGRIGDYDLLQRMMCAAKKAGIPFSIGIPLTKENAADVDELLCELQKTGCESIRLFIPHGEGRGESLENIRITKPELMVLSDAARRLLHTGIYRAEAEWLIEADPVQEENRMSLVSLRPEVIERYERMDADAIVSEIEELDERYYAAFPPFSELAQAYGDSDGKKMYRIRDLYARYRSFYATEHGLHLYDVTDERQSGSRRY